MDLDKYAVSSDINRAVSEFLSEEQKYFWR
jgi:hypothetical protein